MLRRNALSDSRDVVQRSARQRGRRETTAEPSRVLNSGFTTTESRQASFTAFEPGDA